MTLLELRARVDQVIAENAKRWPERNEVQLAIELESYGKLRKNGRRKYKQRFVKLNHLSGTLYGIGEGKYMVLSANEQEELK